MKRLLLAALFTFVWVSPGYAQTCTGNMSFDTAPRRVGGDIGFSANSFALGGGYGRNFDQFFALGGAFFQNFSDIGGGFGVLGSVGTERQVGADQKFSLCPMGTLLLSWGPEVATDTSLSTLALDFGASVGFEASRSGTTAIVPRFGATISVLRTSFGGPFDFSNTETFLTLQAGVGIIFNDQMSLVPTVRIPVGSDFGETLFTVLFTRKLGG
jgi:hypothetical protein